MTADTQRRPDASPPEEPAGDYDYTPVPGKAEDEFEESSRVEPAPDEVPPEQD